MRILIIGGTRFIGRHIVETALRIGHEVTLFTRGKTNPDLFPKAEHIQGDRLDEVAYALFKDRHFDAVVDTCGYFPRAIELSAAALPDVARYLFISTISVFSETTKPGLDEGGATGMIEDGTVEEVNGETYGPLKALCEKALLSAYAERSLIIRPGIVVGPHDSTDRFTYWPVRFARDNGPVLAPDRKAQPAQWIDVRDLAEFCILSLERNASGIYNVTGPEEPPTFEAFLDSIREAINPGAEIQWTETSLLAECGVEPWSDLPMALPYDGSLDGIFAVKVSKAVAAGLKFRPLAQTAKETLDWWRSAGEPELKAGLTAERERELLARALEGTAKA